MRRKVLILLGCFAVVVSVLWSVFGGVLVGGFFEVVLGEAAGAPVTVASCDVSLTAGRLTLRGLAVADRHDPEKNLLEAEEAHLDISPAALLKGRLHVEELRFIGVRFGTPRSVQAEEPEGREKTSHPKQEQAGEKCAFWRGVERWLKGRFSELPIARPERLLSQLDPRRLIESGQLECMGLFRRVEGDFEKWRGEVLSEAADLRRRAAQLKARLNTLRKKSRSLKKREEILAAVAEATRLLKDLSGLKKSSAALRKRLKSGPDLRRLEADFNAALQRDINRLKERYTFGGFRAVNISGFLFGERLVETAREVWWWGRLLWRYMPRPSFITARKSGRFGGQKIRIKPRDRQPSLILRSVRLSLDLTDCARLPGELRGTFGCLARNISSEPKLLGEEVLFEFSGRPAAGGRARVTFCINPLKEKETVSLTAQVEGLPLEEFRFGPRNLRLTGRGQATIRAEAQVIEEGVLLLLDADVKGVEIRPAGEVSGRLAGVVVGALGRVRGFRLKAKVKIEGEHHVELSASSDLDRVVGDALAARFREEAEAARKEFEERLRRQAREKLALKLKELREKAAEAVKGADTGAQLESLEKSLSKLLKSLRKKAAKSLLDGLIR